MKTIGIIGAMEVEVAILKEKMEDVRIIKKASMDFYEGILAGKKVVVVRSGIGKVNAGICAQILADVFSVDAIINTGIAGSLNKNINIGDIVLSTDVVQHDMDATGFGYRKGQIPQMPVFFFNADDNLRRLAAEVCKEVNPDIQVFEGRIASGDQFVCDQDVKNRIVSEFSAYATEMEGAAIGQAAYLNENVRKILPELLKEFQVIHICGKGKTDESIQLTGYVQYEYVQEQLPDMFALADVVISRAGANAICELAALSKPNLLIPLSAKASRGDQILNARSFERQGYSMVLEEEEITESSLLEAIRKLYQERNKYIAAMSAGKNLNSIQHIVNLIEECIHS